MSLYPSMCFIRISIMSALQFTPLAVITLTQEVTELTTKTKNNRNIEKRRLKQVFLDFESTY
jgi:hypothetical protein